MTWRDGRLGVLRTLLTDILCKLPCALYGRPPPRTMRESHSLALARSRARSRALLFPPAGRESVVSQQIFLRLDRLGTHE
jgi:hypothetical protein